MSTARTSLRAARFTVPAAALALALAACAPSGAADDAGDDAAAAPAASAGPITVEHAQGTTELEGVPATVFSFDWGATSVIDALGVEVQGVPKQNAPTLFADLASSDSVIDVGTLFEPDYETIAAQAPDLVIVGGRSSATLPELKKIAPTVDLSNDWTDNVESSKANALTIGRIFGKEAEAQKLVDTLDASIADVKAKAADAGTALIVLTSGGEVTAYGAGGRFGFLHDSLGFAPAADISEEAQHGQAISFEFILETDPDWLFVIDRDSATGQGAKTAEQVLDNEIIAKTKAAANNQIVYVDPTTWYIMGGGVVALQSIADEVGAVLDAR
ncbi:siderophore ABC transporter substrate-binding protein [Xylanimonas ulmi]|uniref:Iron complex transport system substrate-binding protein n=1 Tax=Xylanimonas ulmi TaxID=228973 RepID=A0A4Q7M0X3_9MICO|nr:ABC transporter substrate-binding protein [Xylanibacterium ulmi]RZS61436.1 iron complex transport system substrate-binding protein [Xylanibacterium ulmi]